MRHQNFVRSDAEESGHSGNGFPAEVHKRGRNRYVDLLAERHNQSLKEEAKFFGYTARVNLGGEDVRLRLLYT